MQRTADMALDVMQQEISQHTSNVMEFQNPLFIRTHLNIEYVGSDRCFIAPPTLQAISVPRMGLGDARNASALATNRIPAGTRGQTSGLYSKNSAQKHNSDARIVRVLLWVANRVLLGLVLASSIVRKRVH